METLADVVSCLCSYWGVFIGIGAAFDPMIGGFLIDQLSWRWIFLLNVPIALGGLPL
ncbi:MFS transporter [Chroococcidiopsis cubana]|uniref:MFS transporter n=1 Tax=Chroococcidiopsis cubana TaxID=171392 RepID=UPI0011B2991F|nr:MFS transporter [Chroococcidiopsis cubana]